jgi:hypothetical protein
MSSGRATRRWWWRAIERRRVTIWARAWITCISIRFERVWSRGKGQGVAGFFLEQFSPRLRGGGATASPVDGNRGWLRAGGVCWHCVRAQAVSGNFGEACERGKGENAPAG